MRTLYSFLAPLAMLFLVSGCSAYRPMVPQGPTVGAQAWDEVVSAIRRAPWVEIRGDRVLQGLGQSSPYLERIVFEYGGRLQRPPNSSHDARPLVLSMSYDSGYGALNTTCSLYLFSVSWGYNGSPWLRGEGRQCYSGSYRNTEYMADRAFLEALRDLHPPRHL